MIETNLFSTGKLGVFVEWSGPGSKYLIEGNLDLGYFGQVSSAELLKESELNEQLNLVNMGLPLEENVTWLKFAYNGRILFIAKKPVRYSMSWESIYLNGLVFGTDDAGVHRISYKEVNQARNVFKDGHAFRVRLLKGVSSDVSLITGREWNDLIYRVYAGDPTGSNWESFSDASLGTDAVAGSNSWTQERYSDTGTPIPMVTRGGYSTSGSASATRIRNVGYQSTVAYNGWRPCLELVLADDPLLKPLENGYEYQGIYPIAPGGLDHSFDGFEEALASHTGLSYEPVGTTEPSSANYEVDPPLHETVHYTTLGVQPVNSADYDIVEI